MSGEVVDADGHIMEPSDLWEKNIEPRYRERALRIRKDEDGLEYMEIDGRKSKIMNGGSFGGYSGIGATLEEREAIWFKSGGIEYENARFPAAKDPDERIKWMDEKGIDASVLYPSMGISWQTECRDPELAAAYCRVYNDWLADFCRAIPTDSSPSPRSLSSTWKKASRRFSGRRGSECGVSTSFHTLLTVSAMGIPTTTPSGPRPRTSRCRSRST